MLEPKEILKPSWAVAYGQSSMLKIKEVKSLMGDETISDEEATAIRDACYELSAILLEAWKEKQEGEAQEGGTDQ